MENLGLFIVIGAIIVIVGLVNGVINMVIFLNRRKKN